MDEIILLDITRDCIKNNMNPSVAKLVGEFINKLIAHRDQTVGLWATDRKDLVKDEKNVLFQIKF